MPDFEVFPSPASSVNLGSGTGTVTNDGPGTVYYRGNLPVSPILNDGSLAPGASVTLAGTQNFVADTRASVHYVTVPASSSGAVTQVTKRVTMPISAPPDYASGSGLTDVMQRWALVLPVDTTRWRLKIRNKGNAGALTMTDIYQGTPSYNASGVWASGNFTATPTNIYALSADSFPSDGSEFTSGWITAAGSQFSADVVKGLSFGFTLGAGVNVCQSTGYGGPIFFSGAGASASASAATAVGSSSFATPRLDVRLEVEFTGSNRVVLFIGDSVTSGAVDVGTIAGSQPAVTGPNVLWPALAGMRDRFMWINAAVHGKDYTDFTAASVYLTRLDLATTVPDEAILACGINTLNVSSVATELTALLACIDTLKTIGVKRLKLCTVVPQARWKPGKLTAFAAIGATSIVSTATYANAEAIDIGLGINAETVTASGASTGTKAPFTTAVSALTKDHGVGETTGLATESKRKTYNATIQLGLRDIETIVDLAKALSDGSGVNGLPNPDYYGALPSTITHPNVASWAAMADTLRIT